tara:strand:+ start:358 stop:615 length:258 start_codon:yes stop_codon:yes gene_type:complete
MSRDLEDVECVVYNERFMRESKDSFTHGIDLNAKEEEIFKERATRSPGLKIQVSAKRVHCPHYWPAGGKCKLRTGWSSEECYLSG